MFRPLALFLSAAMMPPLLVADTIRMHYPAATSPALDGVSLALGPGETLGLVGPDGGGKSTLLRLLAGLGKPDAGTITLFGAAPTPANRADISYMPQGAGLYDDLSVIENLTLFANLRGMAKAEQPVAFDQVLRVAGLEEFRDRLAGQLSGGMRQKLGLACALVTRPRVVLLDEPSVGVDPVSRLQLWGMVSSLAAEGIGIIWATSNLDEAEKCDRVMLLHQGRSLYDGPPRAFTQGCDGRVYRIAASGTRARRMLTAAQGSRDVIDGTIEGAHVRLLLREGAPPPEFGALSHLTALDCEKVAPRFEDAFIDRLGGTRVGPSVLSENYRTIPESEEPTIFAENLVRYFGSFRAVGGISLSIPRGQIFGLLGPNGAGKTTVFRMLCGLIDPDSGVAQVAGHDVARARAAAHQALGYMAQRFSLYADLTVAQNLRFFAGAYGMDGAAKRAAVDQALALFDLEPVAGTSAGALQQGYRQRLSLACAIMHQPAALFLDEPTSGVDPLVRREFWSHINAMAARGVTIFVTTHFMDEAEYCDRIALVYRGQMIASGTPDELKRVAGGVDPTLEQAFIALIKRDKMAVAA